MKKFRGTRYAHIGTSYTPALDAEIDRVEAMVLNQQARINELSLRVQRLLGLEPMTWSTGASNRPSRALSAAKAGSARCLLW